MDCSSGGDDAPIIHLNEKHNHNSADAIINTMSIQQSVQIIVPLSHLQQ